MTPQTRRLMARFAHVSFDRIRAGRAVARRGIGAALQAAAAPPESRDNERTKLETIAREFHSMSGEAGLLGIVEVMALARAAEQAVKELITSSRTETGEHCKSLEHALADLDIALRTATRGAIEFESSSESRQT